ncbi:energy-coupling factor transport system ATP-binding protein [Paenibacillus sp. UNCCL117]|uniref:energy-coupling factor ABC transporter ATP-binding protein n=1 Tax=unclassified Paenibacillus TaxID=185978 RepID=UPI000884FC51|nr:MULTISPECIES: ABC transporter ATP-binding protein [unclassified Paenibacillus]SDC66565.1 energy-coupling factor transport system ATP-binding protein [Paenibacillus sp. cl123]SFW23079.1 energy-coupling factor transport system ATP-binding protein [Paenibacillus sp. UNCCL117]
MSFSPLFLSMRQAAVQFSSESGSGGGRKALSDITLDIRQGEFVALVGPNGSGKSTLASVMLGLCPLSRGSLAMQENSKLRGVLQQPDTQVLGDTVEEEFALTLRQLYDNAEQLAAVRQAALLQVGLRLAPGTPFSSLSGGQRQLVNIALALAARPDGLLLDEATAMLDPHTREHMLELVKAAHSQGATIIWITHRMEEAAAAERIIALQAGELAFDGTPEAFFYSEPAGLLLSRSGEASSVCAGNDRPDARSGISGRQTASAVLQPAPCERLALEPPYVVRTVKALRERGIAVEGCPLQADQLAAALQACHPLRREVSPL